MPRSGVALGLLGFGWASSCVYLCGGRFSYFTASLRPVCFRVASGFFFAIGLVWVGPNTARARYPLIFFSFPTR